MDVYLGEDGLDKSQQEPFSKTTKCCHCKGIARIAFVAHEIGGNRKRVCELHSNGGVGHYWLHDNCSAATYLCRDCLKATTIINQG